MIVRPRVISPLTGEAILAEDAIAALLDQGHKGTVQLLGVAGSGKTTAIEFLGKIFAERSDVDVSGVDFVDDDWLQGLDSHDRIVVFTSWDKQEASCHLQLAPWGTDELIEYLLAVQPGRCRSVMQRLSAADDINLVAGLPELWRIVLDRMVGDDTVPNVASALRTELHALCAGEANRILCGNYCLEEETGRAQSIDSLRKLKIYGCDTNILYLIRHAIVRRLLAADRLVEILANIDDGIAILARKLPRELVAEVGRQISDNADALSQIGRLAIGRKESLQPMAASIAFAADRSWKPNRPPRNLAGAYLNDLDWPGADLSGVNLTRVSFNRADLKGARLDKATAIDAQFNRSCLQNALLDGLVAKGASFWRADLSNVVAKHANFENAQMQRANLADAELISAVFDSADLSGACLERANLSDAYLVDAEITDADFSNADLSYARIWGLNLQTAYLTGANFAHVEADGCDLEFVELPDGDFSWASLVGAHLTGSVMPGANFQQADLRNAGLADVQWEDVDLRKADLRGCSFHMGSSRSGLVGSPYPSHGTRTGFYTDDYDEQYFKAPEQIRKANLRGADLRGAQIDDVDFYLVDLRDAQYDDEQEQHFRRCGAILGLQISD